VEEARQDVLFALDADPAWHRLDEEQRAGLIQEHYLNAPPPLRMGTDEEIVEHLRKTPLPSFDGRVMLLRGALERIRVEMAKILEPETVVVSLGAPVTLKTLDDLDAYLEGVRRRAMAELEKGNPVMLK
jgi:hypothetical protein